ncbi:MAG: hypothetical protein ABIN58_03995 [candidate division WOR-3 bacterium]
MPYYYYACPNCSMPKYRSICELEVGQKLDPALFEPTGGQRTPPGETPQPVCDACGEVCVLVVDKPPEAKKQKPSRYEAPLAGTGNAREVDYSKDIAEEMPVSEPVEDKKHRESPSECRITPLFELQPGEEMLAVKEIKGAYLFVTNKRALKLEV